MKKLVVLLFPFLSLACAGAPPEDTTEDETLASDDTPGGPEEATDDPETEKLGTTTQAASVKCGTDVWQSGQENVGNITYYGFIVDYRNCGSSAVRRKVKGYPFSGKCKTIQPNQRVMLKAFTSPWYIYKGVVSC